MAIATPPLQHDPATNVRPLRSLLGDLRRRIRAYVWVQGVASLAVAIGACFWVGLAIDWLLEPSPALRVVGWLVALAIVGHVAYRTLLNRAFVPLPDASLALLLERRFEDFDDSLLTVIELAEKPAPTAGYDPRMLQHTGAQAVELSRRIQVHRVLDRRPLMRTVSAAAVLVASIVLFGVFANEVFGFWMKRISLSPELWPRKTHLMVEGFPENNVLRVGRNSDVELRVLADATLATPPPSDVEIRYRLDDDGGRGRDYMTREGTAVPGRDKYQTYRYEFKDVVDSLSFDIVGGDARIRNLRIEVVDRPQFVGMTLDLTYPAYMNRAPRTLDVTGVMQIPEGTMVALQGESNKPLSEVAVQDRDLQSREVIDMSQAADRNKFVYNAGELTDDKLLMFVMADDDGIQNQQPYRLSLSMTPDEPPLVAVALSGIGSAITPSARIPLAGEIADDYGLSAAWFRIHVDQQPERRELIEAGAVGREAWSIDHALDARAWAEMDRLEPGQRVVLEVQAIDHYDLSPEPHVGSSQRFILDVVTPDELFSMLEGREMMLRQRFETIYNELEDTRDLLTRIEFAAPEDGGAEGVDASANSGEDPAVARRRLRVIRAMQNVQRGAYETLGVAAGFDEIREELVNNRIENEQVLRRLRDQIAEPLRIIGEVSMPQLEADLTQLQPLMGDAQTAPAAVDLTIAQADEVLVEMKRILDRMLELESYNEIVELLRAILDEQQRINEDTQNRRLQRLFD